MSDESDLLKLIYADGENQTYSVYEALRRNLVPKEHLEAALELLERLPYPRKPATVVSGRCAEEPGPSWDDAVRALEEDR
jgi:hypothetical protein